jgi:hypothetical protein
MKPPRALVLLALVVLILAAVWIADTLVLRHRLARGRGVDTFRVYLATRLKSGKVEVFADRHETEVCVRALLPHLGYKPCWYLRRGGGVKVI